MERFERLIISDKLEGLNEFLVGPGMSLFCGLRRGIIYKARDERNTKTFVLQNHSNYMDVYEK